MYYLWYINQKQIMKTTVQFIYIPGFGGALYRVDNGERLHASYLVCDCHGNYRVVETLGFHRAPLKNGELLEVTVK